MKIKKIPARFYLTASGGNPVRQWLMDLPVEDRRQIGFNIGAVEYGWPVGMPLCGALGKGCGRCEVLWQAAELPG